VRPSIFLCARTRRVWSCSALVLATAFVVSNVRAQTPVNPGDAYCSDSVKLALLSQALASSAGAQDISYAAVRGMIGGISAAAYPELAGREIQLRPFHSASDYFRTRFSVSRFLFFQRMHYFVEVNPELFSRNAPADGVCAILGHELAHVADLSHGNRIRLFRLVRLASRGYTVRFERRADLDAIRRGFGGGLISYRNWVYKNVPVAKAEEKKRNYFTPQEIAKIQELAKSNPQLFDYWKRKVPLNEGEIESSAAAHK